ncbi:MAG: transport-associated protein [Piscirickettsiaceae bacterium]|nr:MAG: transport-associated protein [Piscirickettsiaceae bacterium]
MILVRLLFCALCFSLSAANAFELSDITDSLFVDRATGVEGQLKDAEFEFKVNSALLLDVKLRKNTHILVFRNRNSVLIAGQAVTQALKDRVLQLVLDKAHLKWRQGDVNHVEPSNAQVCGEKASKMAANERRRFNLKTAEECSTVNRFYNEVRVAPPRSEIEKSDDELRRAIILNKLLRASVIQSAGVIKVVVSGSHIYLLGDQLSQVVADNVTAFVEALSQTDTVVPLFRF